MANPLKQFLEFRLNSKTRREAMLLVRDVRRILRKYPQKVTAMVMESLSRAASELELAWKNRDHDQLRTGLARLDNLSNDHLAFARKTHGRELSESVGIAVLVALLLRGFALEAFKIPSGSMISTLEIGDRIFVDKVSYGLRIPWTTRRLFHAKKPARGEVIVFMNPCTPDRDFIKRVIALEGDSVEVRCDVIYVNGEAVKSVHTPPPNGKCTFWEKREEFETDPWQLKTCSHYVETVGDKSYSTLHSPRRPLEEGERRGLEPYTDEEGDNDFPGHRLPYCRDNLSVEPKGQIVEHAPDAGDDVCRQRRKYMVPPGHVFVMGDNRAHSSDSRDWGPVPLENIKGRALFIWWSSQREDLLKSLLFRSDPRDRPGSPIADWERIGKIVQ